MSGKVTKGKGKGMNIEYGKGEASSWSKSAGKGGKGGKGGGKGPFRGLCYQCNKAGHKAAECTMKQANAVDEQDYPEKEDEVQLGGVWVIGNVEKEKCYRGGCRRMEIPPGMGKKDTRRIETRNSFAGLMYEDDEEEVDILAVDPALPLTRLSSIEFKVADVKKPLASAAKMVKSGNGVVLDSQGSFIMNKVTGECMEVRIKDETFVFDVQYENGELGTITLDSGAGVHVWPNDQLKEYRSC